MWYGTPVLTDSETLQIMVAESNQAPLLEAIGPQQGAEGELIQFTAWGNDADIPPNTLRYQLRDGALAGASIDASTGEFQWLPGEAQGPGTYEVTVEVHDDGTPSLMDRAMMRITVAACPRPNNGDVNGDGVITPTDALSTIWYFPTAWYDTVC